MIPNMSRFNPMGQSGTHAAGSQPPPKEQKEHKEDKDKDKHSSMASIASMGNMMTKKFGAGLHTVTGTSNPIAGPGSGPAGNPVVEMDKKAKKEAQEKKQQIAQVLSILEDVHLQCPQSHAGIIVAYTGFNCAPIMNNGIKFTWYRMSGEDRIDQLEESAKAWYAPTVDDIGSVICLQCEDNFYQGCSRYIECGPIKADSLLCSLADSTVENNTFETTGIAVSLGLGLALPNEEHNKDIVTPEGAIIHTAADTTLTTVLSKKIAFLQFDGRSTVEVDDKGIFISIPTFDNTATSLAPPAATDKKPDRLPGKRREVYPGSPKDGATASAMQQRRASKFKSPRRGLRIPASTGLKIKCAQPLSCVLSVPIKRGLEDELADASHQGDLSEEERMRRFLSSSTVSIPWTYEGHDHSPEAYVNNDPSLSYEEKQAIIREAERDSVIFANTVCALAEFISALPEGTNEICICFSCPDRLVRDTMVLSVRSLAALPSTCSRYERKLVFPWLSAESPDQLVAESTESEALEAKRVLKAKEEENSVLKRERNELTVQLLECREELVSLKSKLSQTQTQDKRGSITAGQVKKGATDEPFSGFPNPAAAAAAAAADPASAAASDIGKAEAFKQLSSKIIELENKLTVANKREAEASKARTDIEARNTSLHTDLTKSQRTCEDLTRKVASLQSLNDAKTQSITLLEKDQEKNKGIILEQEIKLRELEVLRGKLEKLEGVLAETTADLEKSRAECAEHRATIAQQAQEIEDGKTALLTLEQQMTQAIAQLQVELATAAERIHGYEDDAEAHKLVVADRDRLAAELEAANAEKDRLCGEINHQQQKCESLSRDLKKHMKDSATALTEFEKALVRKSEECNDLYAKLQLWEKAEEERQAQEQSNLGQRIFKRIGSIHIPEGLGLGGRSSPTSEDEHSRGKSGNGGLSGSSTGKSSAGSGAASVFGGALRGVGKGSGNGSAQKRPSGTVLQEH